ncbi:hypothetical protein D3C78_959590 [compost metagenome]
MRVYVADSDRCARSQADARRHIGLKLAGLRAKWKDLAAQLGFRQILKTRVKRLEERLAWIAVLLMPHGFVACCAAVTHNSTCQLSDNPVGCLNKLICRLVYFRCLVQNLPDFRHHPLR